MSKPRVAYTPRPDATPQAEIASLTAVYRYVLNRARKEAAPRRSRPDDGTKSKEDSASAIIQK